MIYVVGRYSGTRYGPFASEARAQSFIRSELRASPRDYETVAPFGIDGRPAAVLAVSPRVARRAVGAYVAARLPERA